MESQQRIEQEQEEAQARATGVRQLKKDKEPRGWMSVRFNDLRENVLRMFRHLKPGEAFEVPRLGPNDAALPPAIREKLKEAVLMEKALNQSALCFFICRRSGSLKSNRDMHLSQFENGRWLPVPAGLVQEAKTWDLNKRARWARWVALTLAPRLKAQGKMGQLDEFACNF